MLLIELALGIAIGFVILVFLAAAIHVILWILFFLLILASLGFVLIKFPLEILIAILVIEGMIMLTILLFKGLIGLGRKARLALFDKTDPPGGTRL